MFHVEQKTILLGATSILLSVAQLSFADIIQTIPSSVREPDIVLPLATASTEASAYVSQGMQELLLGDDDAAAEFFTKAIAVDDNCSALAYVGLYLSQHNLEVGETPAISELDSRLEQMAATPPEAYYLSALLQLANRDVAGAQEAFAKRAAQFRADVFSACWSIQLLHYREAGYDENGEIRPLQKQALEQITALYEKHSDNSVVCYLRALVEESAPQISEQAIEAAKKAAKLLPTHPSVQHLLGHILYRSGHSAEASTAFAKAMSLANYQHKELLSLHSRLYHSVVLWSMGKENEALAIRRAMNKLPYEMNNLSARNVFLQWESRTLPMRILILRKKAPQQSEINAAFKAALPEGDKGKDMDKDPYVMAMRCLRDSMNTRAYVAQKKKQDAIVSIRKAEASFKAIESLPKDFFDKHPVLFTPWERLHKACVVAINNARAELYPSSADTWKENIQILTAKPSTLQLPPAVPVQSEIVQPAKKSK